MLPEKHIRQREFDKSHLLQQLADVGVKAGDSLFVHASYKSMGKIIGGPDMVIDTLLEAVSEKGHIMFPAFAFQIDLGPYDPATTPTTMGILAETARKRPLFIRSNFPYNSLTVSGPSAAYIIEDHVSRGHCRPGDPIDRFAMLGGYVLLLGVTFRSNTTIHIGECYGDLPHRRMNINAEGYPLIYADGTVRQFKSSGGPNCDNGFSAVEGIMRERNHIIDGYLGAAPVMLMKGKDVIYDTVDLIRRAPWALYCNNPKCAHCVKNRTIVMDEYDARKSK